MTAIPGDAAPGRIRGMVAAIAAISIFAFGLSLSLPLLAILLERMGASGVAIGLNGAASAAAILFGGAFLPFALQRIPLPGLMLISMLAMAALLLLFPLVPDIWIWMGLRFLFGFAAASLFFCSEIWILSAAPPGKRGLAIGVYGLFLSLGFFAGPALLKLIGPEGHSPFIAGAAISLLATAPVLFAWRDRPVLAETGVGGSTRDVFRFFRTDPAILWAVALFGVIETGAMGLFPVWALRIGSDEQSALTLVALIAAGNVVMQVPMGWLGDRLDRRRLLGFCALVSCAAALLFPTLAGTTWALWLTVAFWGGLVVGLYTFALNELGSRYSGAELARGTGAFMSAYGLGALLSPPILGAAMDALPPHGMFHLLAAVSAAYFLLLILRRRGDRPRI
ncbi:MFS transporter [Pikeienuella sp. HZG-20]|uniref:MFS transporter n=1 Tax=Paludibacillus litoralis TaxID=3133267 RepID=UPI0030EF95F7